MMNIQHLPRDIAHLILQYDGQIVYRNGKYMNRIPKTDGRYAMLLTQRPLPRIRPSSNEEIVDISVRFLSKPRTSFVVTITSMEDDDQLYRWISYTYFPATPSYKLCDVQSYLRM